MRQKPHLWTTTEIVVAIALGCLAAAMTFLF